jgi:nucleoside-diphosphate-sugar epimerase
MPIERVLVTGGTGRLGRFVVAELTRHYRVVTLDRDAATGPDLAVDVLDLPRLLGAMRGQDAVVHLAAIDAAVPAPAATIFDTNVRGTWNVLEAAHATGVRRVVVCSSVSALGIDFTNPRLPPAYLPIDEAHPLRPTQAYGLSKQLGEEIARSFARRGAMAVTCLRPAWVMFPDVLGSLVARLRTGPETGPGPPPAGQEPLPLLRGYVDPEDVARAFRLALARPAAAGDVFFITADDTFEAEPTLRHLERLYGAVPEVRRPEIYRQHPHAGVYDTSRAREILGWTPSVTWAALAARVESSSAPMRRDTR